MDNKQPITIQRGTFVCNIYDVGNLIRLPLANVRKLWKIMFSAQDENRETIQIIKDWLPMFIAECAERIPQEEAELAAAKADAARAHSENAIMGDDYWRKKVIAQMRELKAAKARKESEEITLKIIETVEASRQRRDAPKRADQIVHMAQRRVKAAKADYVKAQKLQAIFNEFITK